MPLDNAALMDVDVAIVEVPRWIAEVATARTWPQTALMQALEAAKNARLAADEASYFGSDLRTYWATLAATVSNDPLYPTLPGGDSFVRAITGSLETIDLQAEYASRQGLGGVLGGLGAAARDVGTAAADAGKAAGRTVTNPVWVWGIAAIVIGVAVIQSGVLRRR